jgi:hypothetical protein
VLEEIRSGSEHADEIRQRSLELACEPRDAFGRWLENLFQRSAERGARK